MARYPAHVGSILSLESTMTTVADVFALALFWIGTRPLVYQEAHGSFIMLRFDFTQLRLSRVVVLHSFSAHNTSQLGNW